MIVCEKRQRRIVLGGTADYEKASAAKYVYKDGNCPYNDDFGRMALRLQPAAGGDGTESRACF